MYELSFQGKNVKSIEENEVTGLKTGKNRM